MREITHYTLFLVIDLECTCWDGDAPDHKETIEIGAVMFDSQTGIVAEWQQFVRPTSQPVLSEYCRNLTSIQQADVDSAPTFSEAVGRLAEWSAGFGPDVWASWGDFDRVQLQRECERKGVAYPLGDHINIKQQYSKAFGVRPCGMAKALAQRSLALEGVHHRGIDDARNIARLLACVLVAIKACGTASA